jgi:4'-phosphopantetheinyl transferase
MSVELKTALSGKFLSRTPLPEPAGVHVWRIDIGSPGAELTDLFHELSSEERDRTGRFHFRPDAERFIAAHGTVRRILSSYTGVPPGDLEFARGPFGKPSLANAGETCAPLRFNMADSGDAALLAVASGCDVGVDIERVAPGGGLEKRRTSRRGVKGSRSP